VISGAGIAGPSLAYWLTRSGYQVVVVKVAGGVRPGGETVDLRGARRAVVERMGPLDQMRARSLDQRGIAWVKAEGKRRAEMPVDAFHGNGMVSQLEILRGDLTDVLYQATARDTDYRFGTRSTELAQSDSERYPRIATVCNTRPTLRGANWGRADAKAPQFGRIRGLLRLLAQLSRRSGRRHPRGSRTAAPHRSPRPSPHSVAPPSVSARSG
jgi:2-polyprenyl-6-methoxyphenol hydroxylase-like FAD-dependent oxidoreductase